MLFRGLLLSFLCLSSLAVHAALPLTPFERSVTYALPNSAEVSAYLHELSKQSPQAAVLSLGRSAGGRRSRCAGGPPAGGRDGPARR